MVCCVLLKYYVIYSALESEINVNVFNSKHLITKNKSGGPIKRVTKADYTVVDVANKIMFACSKVHEIKFKLNEKAKRKKQERK